MTSANLLNAAAVAAMLGISQRAVYDLAAAGRITSYRLGVGRGAVRFDAADVAQYLERCRSDWRPAPSVNDVGHAPISISMSMQPARRIGQATPSRARKAAPYARSR